MGVNSLPKTVTQQHHGCDLNPGLSAPESSMLTTRLVSQCTKADMWSPRNHVTLVPPGKYSWKIHAWQWCSLFVTFLWPLVAVASTVLRRCRLWSARNPTLRRQQTVRVNRVRSLPWDVLRMMSPAKYIRMFCGHCMQLNCWLHILICVFFIT